VEGWFWGGVEMTEFFRDRCILSYTSKKEADKKRSLKGTCLFEILEDVGITFYCGIIFDHNLVHSFAVYLCFSV
jgi:hypothetical protein